MTPQPASKPTFYFIGVSTTKSSIMRVFPAWAEALGLGDVAICGIDLNVHDEPENYRRVVSFLKNDPLSLGALVTTHKLDLLKACRDLFDELDPHAQLTDEVSCLSKRDGRLFGHAKDPITAGLSLEAFLPAGHWERTSAEVLVLGAGGAGLALTLYLRDDRHGANRPSRIHVTDCQASRLEEMEHVHRRSEGTGEIAYHQTTSPEQTASLLASLPPGSLVVNATGLGKDGPGSPLPVDAVFPLDGLVWEFNYRGDLVFLEQAQARQNERRLQIEDGWIYFMHGWTRVIAEVFAVEIPTNGPEFDRLATIAAAAR